MNNFVPLRDITFSETVELVVAHLGNIDPDLMIIGNRILLNPPDRPFLLATQKSEKRLGIIEMIDQSKEFPGQILAHAYWLEQNRYAIANLSKNDFNPALPPFIIGLTAFYPSWQNLLSYINLSIRLFKYTAMSYQGSPVLFFDSLLETVNPEPRKEVPSAQAQSATPGSDRVSSESAPKERTSLEPPKFQHEKFYDPGLTGLTEEEIRYFSN